MNEQPWKFFVATGESRRKLGRLIAQATIHLSEYMDALGPRRYEDTVKWYSSLGDAPVVIGIATFAHPWGPNPIQPLSRLLFFYMMPLGMYWVARQIPLDDFRRWLRHPDDSFPLSIQYALGRVPQRNFFDCSLLRNSGLLV